MPIVSGGSVYWSCVRDDTSFEYPTKGKIMKNKLNVTINLKTLLFFMAFFKVGFLCAAFNFNIHQNRVFEVMYKGPGGIEEVNRRTLFAETKNLTSDLNVLEISSRFGCKTKMGKAFIAYTLERLISPQDKSNTIQNRQNLIQLLLDSPELQDILEKLIHKAIEHEAAVLKLMENRFVMESITNPFVFVDNLQEKNSLWKLHTLWMSGLRLHHTGYELGEQIYTTWQSGRSFWDLPVSQQAMLTGLGLFGLTATTFGKGYFPQGMEEQAKGTIAWQKIPFTLYGVSNLMYGFYKHYAKALLIRDSLYALQQLVDIAAEIEDICNQHSVGQQFTLSSIRSEKGVELLNNLNIDRYKTKEGLMSYVLATPLVTSFMYDIYEHDMNFAPLYASIAEMDAYLAIAKKMTELHNADHTFTFAQFMDAEKPTIHAQDFWNMLVSVGNVVTNDIFEDRNIILTGSNEGGKTTSIRAILQNIMLAQTFGIAAARSFQLTQFDVVHSYLNVSDDILSGKSRFASELKQAKDILERVKVLQPGQKLFFALDELFTGTNGEDGAEAAYRFIDNIASYPRIQFIYATHFNKLKTIGSDNPACVNYKIEPPLRNNEGEFIRDKKGQLVYPYKLSFGANDVNVALERAQDAGIFA